MNLEPTRRDLARLIAVAEAFGEFASERDNPRLVRAVDEVVRTARRMEVAMAPIDRPLVAAYRHELLALLRSPHP